MKDEAFWIKRVEELDAEIAQLKAERDGFALAVESALQEKLYWKLQAEAAFVRGLERAKDVIRHGPIHHGADAAIQAEIDKAKGGASDSNLTPADKPE